MKFVTTRKFFGSEVKDRIFSGYAAAYGNVDHDGDVLHPGAFAKSINEAFPAGKIKVLWQHREPLGMPVKMYEDSKGLFVEARISKTRLGDEAIELINDGVIDSMSVGFRMLPDKYHVDEKGVRHIREGILMEFSAVTFPANEQAVITGIKTLTELGYYTRDIGLSDRQRGEVVGELKSLIALLEKAGQPTKVTAPAPGAALDDTVKTLLGEFKALANK